MLLLLLPTSRRSCQSQSKSKSKSRRKPSLSSGFSSVAASSPRSYSYDNQHHGVVDCFILHLCRLLLLLLRRSGGWMMTAEIVVVSARSTGHNALTMRWNRVIIPSLSRILSPDHPYPFDFTATTTTTTTGSDILYRGRNRRRKRFAFFITPKRINRATNAAITAAQTKRIPRLSFLLFRGGGSQEEEEIEIAEEEDHSPPPPPAPASAPAPAADENEEEEEEEDDDDDILSAKVRQAMIKLGLAPPPPPPSSSLKVEIDDNEQIQQQESSMESESAAFITTTATATTNTTTTTTTAAAHDDDEEVDNDDDYANDADVLAARLSKDLNVDERLCRVALEATASRKDHDENHNEDPQPQQPQPQPQPQQRTVPITYYHEEKARALLVTELERIAAIAPDSPAVLQLIEEERNAQAQLENNNYSNDTDDHDHDDDNNVSFYVRRALAFTEGNIDDARAILHAERNDAQREAQEQQEQQQQAEPHRMETITVHSNLNPTQLPESSSSSSSSSSQSTPARKEEVVFDASASQIQQLVLESPVPVLLDVYADWCGPCKVLTPALERIAVESGGALRLVKVNVDQESTLTSASVLGVTALPTVFGIRNGHIVHSFQGMPKSESFMKNFLMGLLLLNQQQDYFDPPLTVAEQNRYKELSHKLIKSAGFSSFSFAQRERLQDRIQTHLNQLLLDEHEHDPNSDNVHDVDYWINAEETARVLKSLVSNVIRDPTNRRFRTVNLSNKVLATKIAPSRAALAILNVLGFVKEKVVANDEAHELSPQQVLVLGQDRAMINIAPLMIARECIEQWIDTRRYEVAKALRRQRDDEAVTTRMTTTINNDSSSSSSLSSRKKMDHHENDVCRLKIRFDGKNKIHELLMHSNDTLETVLAQLGISAGRQQQQQPPPVVVQITCIAQHWTLTSNSSSEDEDEGSRSLNQTLSSLGLVPSSYLVIKVGGGSSVVMEDDNGGGGGGLAAAAAAHKMTKNRNKMKKKGGSHTMQSVGIYAKDDHNKAELIDGGGGVWYEHNVSDDENDEDEKDDEKADDEEAVVVEAEEMEEMEEDVVEETEDEEAEEEEEAEAEAELDVEGSEAEEEVEEEEEEEEETASAEDDSYNDSEEDEDE